MKILWAKSDFLHPTERGGQIRTIETLRHLHRQHEIHYAAYVNPAHPEAVEKAREYAAAVYPVAHPVPPRRSLAFARQALANLTDELPLSVARYRSPAMRTQLAELQQRHRYDAVVCDFLAMAPNFEDLSRVILFQHNVEYTIWQRHAQQAGDWARRRYFDLQYRRTYNYERKVCQQARHVIAVSPVDRELMRKEFGIQDVSVTVTGVDVEYFAPPVLQPKADLVFVGAMDWMPNIDGMRYFTSKILPLIRKRKPDCSLIITGRSPVPEILALAAADPLIEVTGTVPDVRPHVWNARVSIVPLRIGGGTRLKIYEAMAAGRPVVSTQIGAEGLAVDDGQNIALADEPEAFAARCLELLDSPPAWQARQAAALQHVRQFSWQAIATHFAEILERHGQAAATARISTH